ncbi:hypothetical protein PF005_g4342 [Phytophthora fragariae]|uniref:Protein kinase domain-containing protein n=2 Tax=Phytophthora TaxID=4783 RepID=A0A6A3Z2W0_9STRA|nr:hypothetical protein PF007_g4445 [Phytophthora fragariae]KAE9228358.1 hypothetical protein PF005_g4342 [Phytophthora fragariae]
MPQDEDEAVDARSEDGGEMETFKMPLSDENVALGRLGRIYKAMDRKTGRVLAVECIDVVDGSDEAGEESSPAEFAQQVLAAELGRYVQAIRGDKTHHVFCYDSVSCGPSRVYLRSSSSVVRSLAALQQDFGRFHPLAVKQYIYQIVHGLRVLHDCGISCGGVSLSLSSLFMCGGNIVKIAAWFPSAQAVRTFQTRNILVDSQFCRSSLNLPLEIDEMAQDVRSVAYVMVEMLTGLRARGSLMEKWNMLTKVAADSLEYQVVRSLMELKSLEEILGHQYFSSVRRADSTVIQTSAQATQEHRHIIGMLTEQELTKCQAMKRQYLQQVRAWQAQFEKKYRRKSNPADRPAGIVRLQGRCLALNERMQELNDRLAAVHGSIYRLIADKEALAIDATSPRIPAGKEDNLDKPKNPEGLTTTSSTESDVTRSDSFDRGGGKRSPAQKAFLNRFGSQ